MFEKQIEHYPFWRVYNATNNSLKFYKHEKNAICSDKSIGHTFGKTPISTTRRRWWYNC